MSALGQKQTFAVQKRYVRFTPKSRHVRCTRDVRFDVRFGSKADMCSAKRHVRFTPESGHVRCN